MDQMAGAAHTNGLADYPVVQDPEAIDKLAPDHATHKMTDCNMGHHLVGGVSILIFISYTFGVLHIGSDLRRLVHMLVGNLASRYLVYFTEF